MDLVTLGCKNSMKATNGFVTLFKFMKYDIFETIVWYEHGSRYLVTNLVINNLFGANFVTKLGSKISLNQNEICRVPEK